MGKDSKSGQNSSWVPLNISALEADLAFFEAKLAMLEGEPGSYYKEAQLRVYQELHAALKGHIVRLQGQQAAKGKPALRARKTVDGDESEGAVADEGEQ